MVTKTTQLLKSMKQTIPKVTPIATNMVLPNLSGVTHHQEFQNFFKGMIVLWSGAVADIPNGWQICDGTNGTPDLQDKFIVGAGSTYSVADTGGEATHTLTTTEMPAHTHTYDRKTGGISGDVAQLTAAIMCTTKTAIASSSTGGDGAHENRPPYYALAYIMKL